MADFAGALAAIKQRFIANWVVGGDPRTRIAYVNENPDAPWPPRKPDKSLDNWVLFSAVGATADHPGFGTPGNQLYLYRGLISITCFVPVGKGTADAFMLAVAAGEIFRATKFYDDVTPGCYVRTWTPRVDGGAPGDDDGAWFRVTATIPFEYWHLG